MARLSQTPERFTCALAGIDDKHKDTKAQRHKESRLFVQKPEARSQNGKSSVLASGFWLLASLISVLLYAIYIPGLYVLLKPLRSFVIVNVPSVCAEALIQCAVPLCA